jgi:hypothetical protein
LTQFYLRTVGAVSDRPSFASIRDTSNLRPKNGRSETAPTAEQGLRLPRISNCVTTQEDTHCAMQDDNDRQSHVQTNRLFDAAITELRLSDEEKSHIGHCMECKEVFAAFAREYGATCKSSTTRLR